MDSKKTTKKNSSKKNGKKAAGKVATELKTKMDAAAAKAGAKKNGKKNKQPDLPPEGAYTVEGPVKDTAGERFLFSIPSQHTGDDDYEHLVVAKDAEEACNLLADARITEKQPDLAGEARAQLLVIATKNYLYRNPEKIEPRTEPAGVLQINHHKLGISSPEVH
jgi:hypothetical protein